MVKLYKLTVEDASGWRKIRWEEAESYIQAVDRFKENNPEMWIVDIE